MPYKFSICSVFFKQYYITTSFSQNLSVIISIIRKISLEKIIDLMYSFEKKSRKLKAKETSIFGCLHTYSTN